MKLTQKCREANVPYVHVPVHVLQVQNVYEPTTAAGNTGTLLLLHGRSTEQKPLFLRLTQEFRKPEKNDFDEEFVIEIPHSINH
jgi:hypothetical protein